MVWKSWILFWVCWHSTTESFFRSWFSFLVRSNRAVLDCRMCFKWWHIGYVLNGDTFVKVVINTRKRRGHKTEPWGTSAMMFLVFEKWLFILTLASVGEISVYMLWSTVSNALLRSTTTHWSIVQVELVYFQQLTLEHY